MVGTRTPWWLVCGVVAATLAASLAEAQASRSTPPTATVSSRPASAAERQALVEALLARWGAYAQETFGADLDVWRDRLTRRSEVADAVNLRAALTHDTFEGAMATLVGRGTTVNRFGDLNQDLVYTPVLPCRILDTRNTAGGAITANTVRNFQAVDRVSFANQGGSATDCSTLGVSATAVAINLTVVSPVTAGFATVFPFGIAQPTTASLNYDQNAVVNNTVIAAIPNPPAASDVSLFSFAESHYVADIVGYFAPPRTTALECVETPTISASVASGVGLNLAAGACDAGFTATGTNCESTSYFMPVILASGGACSMMNNGPSTATARASRTCCRLPGR